MPGGIETPEDNGALELDDQETLDTFHLQEKHPDEEEDLELCSNLDLGDPIEEFEKGDASADFERKKE